MWVVVDRVPGGSCASTPSDMIPPATSRGSGLTGYLAHNKQLPPPEDHYRALGMTYCRVLGGGVLLQARAIKNQTRPRKPLGAGLGVGVKGLGFGAGPRFASPVKSTHG